MIPIRYTIGDAAKPVGLGPKLIAHVCNDVGAWGRGFVLALSREHPWAEMSYRSWYNDAGEDMAPVPFELGRVMFVSGRSDFIVAHMIAQHGIRPDADGRQPIRYAALHQALGQVGSYASFKGASVHMPRIGCGLAGGAWPAVELIINEQLCDRDIPVTVYDLPTEKE